MKISLKSILLILLLVPTLTSCIRDEIEDCPPLQVNIAVKDKNYFNVDKVDMEERRSDDLAFREYVPTLFYMLRDAKTGEVMEEQGVFSVEGEGKTVPVEFCPCLPHGTYVLTVWGGMKDMTSLSKDRTALALHPEHAEEDDIYLVNDTLVYDAYRYDYTVEMERTKGKLIVEAEGLPQGIGRMTTDVNGLFGKVNSDFIYSGETHVSNTSAVTADQKVRMSSIMAPSVGSGTSLVDVSFTRKDGASDTLLPKPADVKINMERNRITMLKYVFNPDADKFTIYIKVNDNWEEIHGMILD